LEIIPNIPPKKDLPPFCTLKKKNDFLEKGFTGYKLKISSNFYDSKEKINQDIFIFSQVIIKDHLNQDFFSTALR